MSQVSQQPMPDAPSRPSNPKIAALEEEIAQLEAQLSGHDPDKLVKRHIEVLHRYNEVKDATQMLIGRYANIKCLTVKAVHEELDLPLKD